MSLTALRMMMAASQNGGSLYMSATGGAVTTDGNYRVHTFNGSGTFTVTQLGIDPVAGAVVECLVVAGGGGGANPAGGGAGGYLTATSMPVSAQAYPVVVGAGGVGSSNGTKTNGVDSSFNGVTSIGGGHGAWPDAATSGGSGGGGYTSQYAGAGTPGQGYAGGTGPSGYGGGGGGAGGTATGGTNSIGGIGKASSITGTSIYRAGGGNGQGGAGAPLGGSDQAVAGAANTGAGGGNTMNGGSGVVIIRYRFQ